MLSTNFKLLMNQGHKACIFSLVKERHRPFIDISLELDFNQVQVIYNDDVSVFIVRSTLLITKIRDLCV